MNLMFRLVAFAATLTIACGHRRGSTPNAGGISSVGGMTGRATGGGLGSLLPILMMRGGGIDMRTLMMILSMNRSAGQSGGLSSILPYIMLRGGSEHMLPMLMMMLKDGNIDPMMIALMMSGNDNMMQILPFIMGSMGKKIGHIAPLSSRHVGAARPPNSGAI